MMAHPDSKVAWSPAGLDDLFHRKRGANRLCSASEGAVSLEVAAVGAAAACSAVQLGSPK